MSEIQTTQTTQTANEIQKDKCYKLKRSWQMCVSKKFLIVSDDLFLDDSNGFL